MKIRPFQASDTTAVVELWRQCGLITASNDPVLDIERKCRIAPELLLIGDKEGQLIATVMAGYEGHRGWLNYLAVSSGHRGRGYGSQLVTYAETLLREKGAPKINLQVRSTNEEVIAFYRRRGYEIDPVISLGKRLVYDSGEKDA